MATVEETARKVLASLNSEAGFLLAVQWTNDRYRQLVSRAKFRNLRKSSTIDLSAGGATFDAAADARWFGTFIYHDGTNRIRAVERTTLEELDEFFPTRAAQAGGPRVWSEIGLNAGATARKIEVYPAAAANPSENLVYTYWQDPANLDLFDSLPLFIEEHQLREGVLVDAYRFELSRATQRGDANAMQILQNQYERQRGVWEMTVLDAIAGDRGESDDSFLLRQLERAGIQRQIASPAQKFSRE